MAVTSRRSSESWSELSLTSLLVALLAASLARCQQNVQEPINNGLEGSRRHPNLHVLGYVTPWNSRGKELVDEYRHKFDMVSPVWYTIHADPKQDEVYTVRGGPPGEEDEEWYRRLQQPSKSEEHASASSTSSTTRLQVVPRFILDNWNAEDYRDLVLNETRWKLLSDAVMDVVAEKSFDGLVFESGATHALAQPLTALSDALHDHGKILVVVMPPVRTQAAQAQMQSLDGNNAKMLQAHNDVVLRSLPGLSLVADYFSVMTYDMTGPGGRELSMRDSLPGDSKIREAAARGQVREAGPNTSADWVRENLVAFVRASGPEAQNQEQFRSIPPEALQASRKFLMGLPLYGYKYPILWADETTGAIKRTSGDSSGAAVPVLRGAGEPVTTHEILELMRRVKPQVLKSEPEGEYYFDYDTKKPGDGYWRVFLPTSDGMAHVLDTIHGVVDSDVEYGFGGAGIALWEVGQGSGELLASL